MVEVIPSILTNDPHELKEMIAMSEGVCSKAHIDIIDGDFAKNRTISPDILAEVETPLLLDFHLMTKEPVDWVEKCVRGMANRVIGQIEKMSDQFEFISKVNSLGIGVGLAVDLETPLERIESSLLSTLDVIVVMSVRAGFGGQIFNRSALVKVAKLDEIRRQEGFRYRICVDGGVTPDVTRELISRGVNEVSVGRRLFVGEISSNMQKFQKI